MTAELKSTEIHRKRVRDYEQRHDRITLICDKGTRDRINRLGLDCSPAVFAKFCLEFMLNYCERGSHE